MRCLNKFLGEISRSVDQRLPSRCLTQSLFEGPADPGAESVSTRPPGSAPTPT